MATSDELKRAETGLRIAQLKFKNALKREDYSPHSLPSVSIESSSTFCDDVDAVLQRNTTENVQTCKKWIVKHIAPSKTRITVLGEYLVAVSKSIVVERPLKSAKAARNRLDILLIVSDVLHAIQFHREDSAAQGNVVASLRPYIEDLVELAALAGPGKNSLVEKKLKAMVNFWVTSGCIAVDDFNSISERAVEGLAVAQGATPQRKRTYALPEWFGDRSVPWYELSASYMVEPLLKNPDRPIPANAIIATRFDQKQPSERVRKLLENYFENIDLQYVPTADNPSGETKKHRLWLDPMGQLVKQNKETGETTTVCNGYGWSLNFCKEMQENGIPDKVTELREDHNEKARIIRESRWNSTSRDPSRGLRSPPRRRYSYSSDSRSRSRTRSRSSSSGKYNRVDRSRSRDNDSDRYEDRRPRSSRNDGRIYSERPNRFDDRRESDRGLLPSEHITRERLDDRQSRWNDDQSSYPDASRNNFVGPPQQPTAFFSPGAFPSQVSQPPTIPRVIAPLPPPGQYPGFPMPGFPPPPPPPGHFHASIPRHPPPPPNFQGPYQGAPLNTGGLQNNAYSFENNAPAYANNVGYGGQPQGNFRGGFQGGFQEEAVSRWLSAGRIMGGAGDIEVVSC
ncbi:hypothetical protein N0V90_008953 [Kalmusia sp. IMI 367209]|nr:hypothetical protein N0V90_008953 [Kalmusia sp. IMI 367209]